MSFFADFFLSVLKNVVFLQPQTERFNEVKTEVP